MTPGYPVEARTRSELPVTILCEHINLLFGYVAENGKQHPHCWDLSGNILNKKLECAKGSLVRKSLRTYSGHIPVHKDGRRYFIDRAGNLLDNL